MASLIYSSYRGETGVYSIQTKLLKNSVCLLTPKRGDVFGDGHMVDSVGLNSAVSGIYKGFDSLQSSASQIASKATFEGDNPQSLPTSLVGLKTSELQVAASAQVVQAIDETLGTLLDVKA